MKPVTMADIAREVGVSKQAVGFALGNYANSRTKVRPETRDRILRVAADLGYRPNAVAQSMVRGRTYSIGIVGLASTSMLNLEMLVAFSQELEQAGLRMQLAIRREGDQQLERQYVDDMLSRRVDGLVICTNPDADLDYYTSLRERGVPLVLFGHPKQRDTLRVDTPGAMREATQYLIDLGHRRIAYAVGSNAYLRPLHRLTGFRQAMRDAGIAVRKELLFDDAGECTRDAAAEFTRRVLSNSPRATAIMYTNDETAFVGLHTVLAMGLRCPQDVSIVGFDDLPLAQLTWPELTTVRQPVYTIAREAIRLLQAQLDDKPIPRVLITPQLVVRGSTGPAPQTNE